MGAAHRITSYNVCYTKLLRNALGDTRVTGDIVVTAAERADPAALEDEYFNLFIGLGRGELVPYASFYIHGFLMEKVLASLRDELAVLGIVRRIV